MIIGVARSTYGTCYVIYKKHNGRYNFCEFSKYFESKLEDQSSDFIEVQDILDSFSRNNVAYKINLKPLYENDLKS